MRSTSPSRSRRIAATVATLAAGAALVAGSLAGAAPASAAPAPTATQTTTATQPAQWLTGYWHNFDNGSVTMRLGEVPQAYNLVAVAFADNLANTPGGIAFTLASAELGGYTVAQFKADVAAIRAQGRKVVLSVGGERGNVVVSNATEAKNFADSAYALMQEYGFDGIDIDLEHGVNAEFLSDALHQLRAKAGAGFVLTMAPQTIDYQATTMPYYQLTLKVKDILTITNTQFYNSGSMMGADQKVYSQGTVDFLTALAAIELEMGLRPDQVGIGVPAVPRAAGGGYQPIANVVKAVDCLEVGTGCGTFEPATPYGRIGGVMTWSINWDKTNGYELARVVGERLASGPTTPTDPGTGGGDPGTGGGTDPGTCATAAWSATTVYTGGQKVSHQGSEYTAKWWTQGDTPGSAAVWNLVGPCAGTGGGDPGTGTPTGACSPAWSPTAVYTGGATASLAGSEYRAKWWTQGEQPGTSSVWELVSACS